MTSFVWLDTEEDHLRWGVTVKPSKLLDFQELGLYAIKPFKRDDKIAPYLGEELSLEERQKRYGKKWGPYVYFKPWGHPSIDAMFFRSAAAFANDGTWIPQSDGRRGSIGLHRRKADLSNVRLEKGWLRAVHDISEGEELLLNYGESYWKNRFIGDIKPSEKPKLVMLGEYNSNDRARNDDRAKHISRNDDKSTSFEMALKQLTPVVEVVSQALHRNEVSGSNCSIWVKRDDLFEICGVRGGKARACLSYILDKIKLPVIGVVTGGSRSSPQVQIVGRISHCLGLKARLHLPKGQLPQNIIESTSALGHEIFQWFPGFNHVISTRVKEDVKRLNDGAMPTASMRNIALAPKWLEIPFGMEFPEAIQCTSQQVSNLPFQSIKRILLPVGSGMTLIGILTGLKQRGIKHIPVVGIIVGKDPVETINKWISWEWQGMVILIQSPFDYYQKAPVTTWQGIPFDPIYEAKIIPYIEPYDLVWLIGHR